MSGEDSLSSAHSPEMQAILDFVSGAMRPEEFEARLSASPGFERLLDDGSELPENSFIKTIGRAANTHEYLRKTDFSNPGQLLDAQFALEWFLDRRGIKYDRTNEYSDLHGLLLDAQPAWLDVDGRFLMNVLASAPKLKKTALKKWLRDRLKELFRFASRPPRWIQGAEWPIRNGQPLVFLGQFSLKGYFHDDSAVYVFHDPETGECETIIQTY